MLEFNPYHRPSAYQLLQHEVFDSIRQRNNELNSKNKIEIKEDVNDDEKNDYENERKVLSERKHLRDRFLFKIVREAKRVKALDHFN